MSEGQNQQQDGNKPATQTPQVNIKVDRSAEIKELQDQLKKAAEDRKKAEDELLKAEEAKKALEKEKTTLEEEKGDLTAKMQMIAEKEFVKKKDILIEKAEKLFKKPDGEPDEEKINKLKEQLEQEDSKKATEALKMNEYMISHLEEALVLGSKEAAAEKKRQADIQKNKEQATKEAGTEQGSKATGQTPLKPEEVGTSATGGSTEGEDWDSHYAMIADLRRRARDPSDPERQAEAQAHLSELWKKWAKEVRKDYDQGKMDYRPEKQKPIRQLHREGA